MAPASCSTATRRRSARRPPRTTCAASSRRSGWRSWKLWTRRPDGAGRAFPPGDGPLVCGALVVLGPARADSPVAERLAGLALELGPRLAAPRPVPDAERRAVLDPPTGLRNRREFERQLEA